MKFSTALNFNGKILALLCFFLCCGNLSCSSYFWMGDKSMEKVDGPNAIRNSRIPKETVVIELYQIRIRPEHRDLLHALWNDGSTSEQDLPIEVRRTLARDGIRVGIQGLSISQTLARILELDRIRIEEFTGKTRDRTSGAHPSPAAPGIHAEELEVEKLVNGFPIRFLPGKHAHVYTYKELIPEAAIFSKTEYGWTGKSYTQVQTALEISAIPYPDGSGVRFDLLPFMFHGEEKSSIGLRDGLPSRENYRDKHTFQHLKISMKLLPGQWLMIGATGDDPSGIGRHFLTRNFGEKEQKLILIRLAEVKRIGTSDVPDVETFVP